MTAKIIQNEGRRSSSYRWTCFFSGHPYIHTGCGGKVSKIRDRRDSIHVRDCVECGAVFHEQHIRNSGDTRQIGGVLPPGVAWETSPSISKADLMKAFGDLEGVL